MILNTFRKRRRDRKLVQLATSYDIVKKHVLGLIDDARLLHQHGRHARAVSLAVLASEENAKLVWIFAAERAARLGSSFDWSVVNRHAVRHKSKLQTPPAFFKKLYEEGQKVAPESYNHPDYHLIKDHDNSKAMTGFKEMGFYSALSSGSAESWAVSLADSEEIENLARAAIRMAEAQLNVVDVVRTVVHERWNRVED